MEMQAGLEKWNILAEMLKCNVDALRRKEAQIQELRLDMRKMVKGNGQERILRTLSRQEDRLHRQANAMYELQIALEKSKRFYADIEQEIVDSFEMDRINYPEKIQVVRLDDWTDIPVMLGEEGDNQNG